MKSENSTLLLVNHVTDLKFNDHQKIRIVLESKIIDRISVICEKEGIFKKKEILSIFKIHEEEDKKVNFKSKKKGVKKLMRSTSKISQKNFSLRRSSMSKSSTFSKVGSSGILFYFFFKKKKF